MEDNYAARRRHTQMIDFLDREIRETSSVEYQAEETARQAASERWSNLPPSRAPLGTRTCRMTDEQILHADKDGF